jgi:hypothetical protein
VALRTAVTSAGVAYIVAGIVPGLHVFKRHLKGRRVGVALEAYSGSTPVDAGFTVFSRRPCGSGRTLVALAPNQCNHGKDSEE